MMPRIKRLWLLTTVAGGMFAVSALGIHSVIAESFRDPELLPSAGMFARPLTSGTTAETKAGSLIINGNLGVSSPATLKVGDAGGVSQLCLNPASSSLPDCIKHWTEIQLGPYLQYFSGLTSNPASVQANLFARVKAGSFVAGPGNTTYPQEFAIQGKSGQGAGDMHAGVAGYASNFTGPTFVGIYGQAPTSGGPGDSPELAAFFDGAHGQTAVRVEDADVNGDGIPDSDSSLTIGTTASPQGLCLYGDGEQRCISEWSSDIVNYRNSNSGYLILQSRVFSPAGVLDASQPITGQLGNVRVAGHANFRAVVVGTPNAQPACGDGVCSNPEASATCAVDCATLSGLAVSDITAAGATVSWQTSPQTTTAVSYGRSSVAPDKIGDQSSLFSESHATILTGLQSATVYYVRVGGVTASGSSLSSTISFTTL